MNFPERRLGTMMPTAARRELGNEFTDDGTEFLPAPLVDAAVDEALGEISAHDAPAFVMYDLSRKRDLTSRTVVLLEPSRRPEARDHMVVASIRVWDPKTSPTGEVDFADVRADLDTLPQRFPNLCAVLIDEGAEAGALLPFARGRAPLSLVTKGGECSILAFIRTLTRARNALAASPSRRSVVISSKTNSFNDRTSEPRESRGPGPADPRPLRQNPH